MTVIAALGEGEDLRIRSDAIVGGALAASERVIHLWAFAQETGPGAFADGSRMRRASARRQYRTSAAGLGNYRE